MMANILLGAKNPSLLQQFSERFKLETEGLKLQIKKDDEIVGWFSLGKRYEEADGCKEEREKACFRELMEAPERFGSKTNVDRGHTLVNYEEIIKNGLVFYENQIKAELEKYPQNEYLLAMQMTLVSVKNLLRRIAVMLEEASKSEECEKEKLLSFKKMIEKVPYHPAENFCEAVQAVWIIHFLTPLAENAWYSISLGKFDQYMYPYYKKSVLEGMTNAEAKRILYNFYELLNSYADGACLLNVGAAYNELSELLIECQKEFAMPAPILGARVDENTPERIWDALIDEKLFSMGQPTFYSEKSCIEALLEKGLSEEEAKNFSNNSCMGISIPGVEFNSMWGCVFSVPSVLEAAVNGGEILKEEKRIVSNLEIPKNVDKLFENFEKCAEVMLAICVKSYEERARISENLFPDPFVSLLTEGCIEKHCDRISGSKYHNVTVECMGMVNASDGICAIDELVFKQKKYTLEDLTKAVKNNFEGFEDIRNDIRLCKKFGENSAADMYAVKVADILSRQIRSFCHGNLYYAPSLHTLDANVMYGHAAGAGYDGRNAKEPFAKNAGPSNQVRRSDPTSMILSSSKLPQYKFFGGQPIDVHFEREMIGYHKKEIRTLIQIYMERGGLQFQVNSISSKVLREAMENPDKFPNLVVRIGGYSTYFNKIPKNSQKEFVERFEKEEL